MVRVISVLFIAFFFQSCASVQRVKGSYPKHDFITDTPKEQIWTSLISIFAKNGIGIKTIDKSSGLLVSEIGQISKISQEDLNGNIEDSTAYIVTDKFIDAPGSWDSLGKIPYFVSAGWNVVLSELNGKSSISINIVNIQAYRNVNSGTNRAFSNGIPEKQPLNAISTGRFERMIFEAITKK